MKNVCVGVVYAFIKLFQMKMAASAWLCWVTGDPSCSRDNRGDRLITGDTALTKDALADGARAYTGDISITSKGDSDIY